MPYVEPDTTGRLQECFDDLTLLTVLHGADWEKITNKAIEFARGAV